MSLHSEKSNIARHKGYYRKIFNILSCTLTYQPKVQDKTVCPVYRPSSNTMQDKKLPCNSVTCSVLFCRVSNLLQIKHTHREQKSSKSNKNG